MLLLQIILVRLIPCLFLLVCVAKGVDIQEEFIMHFEYLGGDFAANINST